MNEGIFQTKCRPNPVIGIHCDDESSHASSIDEFQNVTSSNCQGLTKMKKKELLATYVAERVQREELDQMLVQLHDSYEKLLAKHAEAENTIDRLRLDKSLEVVNLHGQYVAPPINNCDITNTVKTRNKCTNSGNADECDNISSLSNHYADSYCQTDSCFEPVNEPFCSSVAKFLLRANCLLEQVKSLHNSITEGIIADHDIIEQMMSYLWDSYCSLDKDQRTHQSHSASLEEIALGDVRHLLIQIHSQLIDIESLKLSTTQTRNKLISKNFSGLQTSGSYSCLMLSSNASHKSQSFERRESYFSGSSDSGISDRTEITSNMKTRMDSLSDLNDVNPSLDKVIDKSFQETVSINLPSNIENQICHIDKELLSDIPHCQNNKRGNFQTLVDLCKDTKVQTGQFSEHFFYELDKTDQQEFENSHYYVSTDFEKNPKLISNEIVPIDLTCEQYKTIDSQELLGCNQRNWHSELDLSEDQMKKIANSRKENVIGEVSSKSDSEDTVDRIMYEKLKKEIQLLRNEVLERKLHRLQYLEDKSKMVSSTRNPTKTDITKGILKSKRQKSYIWQDNYQEEIQDTHLHSLKNTKSFFANKIDLEAETILDYDEVNKNVKFETLLQNSNSNLPSDINDDDKQLLYENEILSGQTDEDKKSESLVISKPKISRKASKGNDNYFREEISSLYQWKFEHDPFDNTQYNKQAVSINSDAEIEIQRNEKCSAIKENFLKNGNTNLELSKLEKYSSFIPKKHINDYYNSKSLEKSTNNHLPNKYEAVVTTTSKSIKECASSNTNKNMTKIQLIHALNLANKIAKELKHHSIQMLKSFNTETNIIYESSD